MSMLIAAGVRPTWLVLIMGFIQPQWTSLMDYENLGRSSTYNQEWLPC